MNFEPQIFFIGLINFFSILLPGAALAFLLRNKIEVWVQGTDCNIHDNAEQWVLFFLVSYLLGHFLFLLGSILDDNVYEPIRSSTEGQTIYRLSKGKKIYPNLLRWFARQYFKKNSDTAVDAVFRIKNSSLQSIKAQDAVNAFQWCKAKLALEHPYALAIANRFDADSKFFRSFSPVLIGILMWKFYELQRVLAVIVLVLLYLAFSRYVDQRFKAMQQAYWFILIEQAKLPVEQNNIKIIK